MSMILYVQLHAAVQKKHTHTQNWLKLERQNDASSMTDRGYSRSSFGITTIYSRRRWQLYTDQYHRPSNGDLGLLLTNPSPGFALSANPNSTILRTPLGWESLAGRMGSVCRMISNLGSQTLYEKLGSASEGAKTRKGQSSRPT